MKLCTVFAILCLPAIVLSEITPNEYAAWAKYANDQLDSHSYAVYPDENYDFTDYPDDSELVEKRALYRFPWSGGFRGLGRPGVMRFGKRSIGPGVMRFGKRTVGPGVMRFGKREVAPQRPGVMRFGRRR